MSTSLHDDDIVAWSEQQAALLARLANGERVNGIDWENVVEEVLGVGRSEVNAVRSHLRQCLIHLAKAMAAPDAGLRHYWLVEAAVQQAQAADAFAPAMRQKIDLAELWSQSRELAILGLPRSAAPHRIPVELNVSLDNLVARRFDAGALAERLTVI